MATQRGRKRIAAEEEAIVVDHGYVSEIFASFQGEGARVGERHLFIRMAGCNLRCRYCDTPESLVPTPCLTIHRVALPPTRVANPIAKRQLVGYVGGFLEVEAPLDAVALTGGEPLMQADFLAQFLADARFSVPVLLETNGTLPDCLPAVLPWVTIVSMDIKPPSNTGERAFWDEHAEFLRLSQGKEVYVKVLVDGATSEADVARASKIAAEGGAPVYLQPITDGESRVCADYRTLTRFFAVARLSHSSVRIVPQTHKILGIR